MTLASSFFVEKADPIAMMGRTTLSNNFFALVEQAIAVARPGSAPVLMALDVPGLRSVPAHARQGLSMIAGDRLSTALAGQGFVGAQQAGRFAVLVASDGPRSCDVLASSLLASLTLPIAAHGVVLPVGAWLGAAQWGSDGHTAEELFVAADAAIHAAQQDEALVDKGLSGGHGVHMMGLRFVRSPLAACAHG